MKTGAIIAEYNPFHNGHLYQIEEAKKALGLDRLIIIMSQDVVQRGEFASFDKYFRTRKALESGADLVIGLPAIVSGASAEFFAKGAVDILNNLDIDYLIFGAESDSLDELEKIAELLNNEDETFKSELKKNLKDGSSFARSRYLALSENKDIEADLLNSPNNILAVEYLKALKKTGSKMRPFLIKRTNDYHESNLTGPVSSATAIRESLERDHFDTEPVPYSIEELKKNYSNANKDLIYNALQTELFNKTDDDLLMISGINRDFLNRLRKVSLKAKNLDELIEGIKTKNISRTTINRNLLNIILNISKNDLKTYYSNDYNPYLRVLGFTNSGKNILKDSGSLVLTNIGSQKKKLDELQEHFLDQDIKASNFRSLFTGNNQFNQDFYNSPIIV